MAYILAILNSTKLREKVNVNIFALRDGKSNFMSFMSFYEPDTLALHKSHLFFILPYFFLGYRWIMLYKIKPANLANLPINFITICFFGRNAGRFYLL